MGVKGYPIGENWARPLETIHAPHATLIGGWLTGWKYRKAIPASRASGAVNNYQMTLVINRSAGTDTAGTIYVSDLCLSNYNDIRFTNGTTLLDYWILSSSSATATIIIKLDKVPTGSMNYYCYFGNGAAGSYSNGVNTFLCFDHFDAASIDTSLWEGDTGSASLASSIMTFTGDAAAWKKISTIGAGWDYGYKLVTRAQFKAKTGSKGSLINFRDYLEATKLVDILCFDTSELGRTKSVNYRTVNMTINEGAYHIYEVRRESASTVRFLEDSTMVSITDSDDLGAQPIGFQTIGGASYNILVDWVYVAQYLATEPAWGTPGALEVF